MKTNNKKQPNKEPTPPVSAAQSWRDRLNSKHTTQQNGHIGNTGTFNTVNRSENNSPISTARKSKKGHRPG